MGKPVNVEQEHVFMTADEEKYFKENQLLKNQVKLLLNEVKRLLLEKIELTKIVNASLNETIDGTAEDLGYRKVEL